MVRSAQSSRNRHLLGVRWVWGPAAGEGGTECCQWFGKQDAGLYNPHTVLDGTLARMGLEDSL